MGRAGGLCGVDAEEEPGFGDAGLLGPEAGHFAFAAAGGACFVFPVADGGWADADAVGDVVLFEAGVFAGFAEPVAERPLGDASLCHGYQCEEYSPLAQVFPPMWGVGALRVNLYTPWWCSPVGGWGDD
jgi:hypothetical protein